jgi:hypothetical protein
MTGGWRRRVLSFVRSLVLWFFGSLVLWFFGSLVPARKMMRAGCAGRDW